LTSVSHLATHPDAPPNVKPIFGVFKKGKSPRFHLTHEPINFTIQFFKSLARDIYLFCLRVKGVCHDSRLGELE